MKHKILSTSFGALLIFVLALSVASISQVAKATQPDGDSCNQEFEYTKSSDFNDDRVSIDFTNTASAGNPDKVEIEAENGYTLVRVELDVEGDGQAGYYDYSSQFPGEFNPNPGTDIDSARVRVAKVCNKVTICHSTSSHSNPYVQNQPNTSGDVQGHDDHDGGVYPADPWGDIIPPFYYDGGYYPGKNWNTAGQAIYNNDCNVPGASPSPSPSCSPSPSPSPSQPPSPSPSPSPSEEPTPTPSPSEPVDLCTNLAGIQTVLDPGVVRLDDGRCISYGVSSPKVTPQVLGTTAPEDEALPVSGANDYSLYYLGIMGFFGLTYLMKKFGWKYVSAK